MNMLSQAWLWVSFVISPGLGLEFPLETKQFSPQRKNLQEKIYLILPRLHKKSLISRQTKERKEIFSIYKIMMET